MALLLSRPSRWRGVVFLAVFLPWAYPGGVTVVAWYWMLNPPLITSYSLFAGNLGRRPFSRVTGASLDRI